MNRVSIPLALVLSCLLASLQAADSPWFKRVLVGMEIGPTGAQFGYSDTNDTRYCARYDGREMVRQAVAAHSEYLVYWARDGDYAYYNSILLPKAPGLGSRDPLQETLQEAKRHSLPVIAYCVVQQGGHFLKAHPEWEMQDASGRPIGRFCYNSGYLEAMKQIVAEQLAYGIDGFHIDMMDQGFGPPYGCWCGTCRAAFEKEMGHPMPQGVTWDSAWNEMLEFRYRSSERFEKSLCAFIKSLNPQATVDFNYHGNPPFSFEVGQRTVQHAGNGDFITGETGVWGFSALTVGLNAEFYHAAVPQQRVQVAMQRGVRMYHDQTTRPLMDLRWELFTLLAHGAFVTMVDKTGFDGGLDPIAYERIATLFEEARDKRSHFGQRRLADVGLYFSSRSRDWLGRERPSDYFQSFLGAHKTMVYEHIPWAVVLDENVTIETLRQFPILMLPNAAILSEQEVALFISYVTGGGQLIVTGHSGQLDRLGQPRSESALGELIGAKVIGRLASQDNWVKFGPPVDTITETLSAGMAHSGRISPGPNRIEPVPFLVKGPATIYQPTTAQSYGELIKPYRTTRQQEGKEGTEWPMSADSPVGPALLINRVGQGRVVTFSSSPDFAAATEHHMVEARRWLANALHWLHPTPRIRISAPVNVETVAIDDPAARTLRVHLLGYNSPPQTIPAKDRPFVLPRPIEDAPLYRVQIDLGFRVKHSKALNKSTVLLRRGNRVEATISDIHEVLIIKY